MATHTKYLSRLVTMGLMASLAAPLFADPAVAPLAQPVEWRHTKRCGINCLYVMLRMLGTQVRYENVVAEAHITDQGTTIAELVRLAANYGTSLQPVRATKDTIRRWPLPAIVHLQNQDLTTHYVLLLRASETGYVVLDCNSGELREWGPGEFLDKWTGYVLLQSDSSGHLFSPFFAGAWVILGCATLALGLWWRKARS
jgi:ABC-type bacteriocin/lantibiotic exporter with double-glycine peptidase domain